jgi:LPS sulfotransferase NodH
MYNNYYLFLKKNFSINRISTNYSSGVFILFTNRSGSNYFTDLLNQSDELDIKNEIFNQDQILNFKKNNIKSEFIDFLNSLDFTKDKKKIGCKLSLSQLIGLKKFNFFDLFNKGVKFIHIRRRDVYDQGISWHIAKINNQFASYQKSQNNQIKFNYEEILKYSNTFSNTNMTISKYLIKHKLDFIDICYEDILNNLDTEFKKICNFLNIDFFYPNVEISKFKKQTNPLKIKFKKEFIDNLKEEDVLNNNYPKLKILNTINLKKKLIFLHIPKTAGQSIRFQIESQLDKNKISPIQSYEQNLNSNFIDVDKYDYYGGHINFFDLHLKFNNYEKFVFTILREPKDRLASFYFYLKKEALKIDQNDLNLKKNTGAKIILSFNIENYFYNSIPNYKRFISDMYKNFYVRFFSTKVYRTENHNVGSLELALQNILNLDFIGFIDRLDILSDILFTEFKLKIDTNKFINVNNTSLNKITLFQEQCDKENKNLYKSIINDYLSEDLIFYEKIRKIILEKV